MKIQVSERAQEDLLAGYEFYERQSSGIGQYFLDSLFADIDSLLLFHGVHQVVHRYHRLMSRRFPFAIYYRVVRSTVRVYRILDCRRNPRRIPRALRR